MCGDFFRKESLSSSSPLESRWVIYDSGTLTEIGRNISGGKFKSSYRSRSVSFNQNYIWNELCYLVQFLSSKFPGIFLEKQLGFSVCSWVELKQLYDRQMSPNSSKGTVCFNFNSVKFHTVFRIFYPPIVWIHVVFRRELCVSVVTIPFSCNSNVFTPKWTV